MQFLTPAMKAAAAAATPTQREQMRALTLKHLAAMGAVPVAPKKETK
jgi:hypothetical protein